MNSVRIFIIIFIELSNFMLLWNFLNKGCEKRLVKSVVIILFTSLLVLVTNYLYAPVEFFINYLFLFWMIKISFKKNIKQLLLEFSLLLSFFAILQIITIMMMRIINSAFLDKDMFFNNLTANVICFFISLCICKCINYKKLSILYQQESSKIYFFSINLLIYILTAKWMWNFKRQVFFEEIIVFLIVPAVYIFGNTAFLMQHIRNTELRKSLEEYKKYSLVISELFDNVRRRQHDFKNHLNTIYGLIQISDEKTLKETVSQYMDSVNTSLENIDKVLQIKNKVVTAIIYNKINEADKAKIKFKYNIQCNSMHFPFRDYELSELLNNLLDNAFEAVLSSETNSKKIFLNIGCLEEGCIIEIGNSGKRVELNDIGKIFELDYTTKKGEGHGYGLYNVKKIVESYGGRIQLSFENSYTIFRVILL